MSLNTCPQRAGQCVCDCFFSSDCFRAAGIRQTGTAMTQGWSSAGAAQRVDLSSMCSVAPFFVCCMQMARQACSRSVSRQRVWEFVDD